MKRKSERKKLKGRRERDLKKDTESVRTGSKFMRRFSTFGGEKRDKEGDEKEE
jgi:hypothetical protein